VPPATTIDSADLFRAHAGFVAGFVASLGVDADAVDDIVQDVFLTAHRKGGYRPGAAQPTTWLAGLALGIVANARRRTGRRRSIDQAKRTVERSSEDLAARADARRSLARATRALAQLEENHRVVLMLYELEGESCGSIAAGLGVKTGTVYSRLHAARKAFRRAYDALGPDLPESEAP
jgi:RNA polymerase sigma-70 factor (ECF subfamily)